MVRAPIPRGGKLTTRTQEVSSSGLLINRRYARACLISWRSKKRKHGDIKRLCIDPVPLADDGQAGLPVDLLRIVNFVAHTFFLHISSGLFARAFQHRPPKGEHDMNCPRSWAWWLGARGANRRGEGGPARPFRSALPRCGRPHVAPGPAFSPPRDALGA